MHKKVFFTKVVQMALTMVSVNISGILYAVFLSGRVGAEGMGLFHLMINIWSVGISLSVSGMGLTVTRLLSDMPRDRALAESGSIVGRCLGIVLATSGAGAVLLSFFAHEAAAELIGDAGCAPGLRILAPSLVCTAVSAVFGGCYAAFGKVGAMAVGSLCGEATKWIVAYISTTYGEVGEPWLAPVMATSGGAAVQCICDIALWRNFRRGLYSCDTNIGSRDVVKLCAPLALGSWLRTGLVSAENLLIPPRLSSGGVTSALGNYGIIKGMTMPVMFFPATLVGAFTTLLVPEIARRHSSGNLRGVRGAAEASLRCVICFGIGIFAIFAVWGREIGALLFGLDEAGRYLRMLAVLAPLMFADSITDAVLKGLDDQVYSLRINIADSCMRILLIFVLVPVLHVEGYILIMYISEIINFVFSYRRLRKRTALHPRGFRTVLKALLCASAASVAARYLCGKDTVSAVLLFGAGYSLLCILTEKIRCHLTSYFVSATR